MLKTNIGQPHGHGDGTGYWSAAGDGYGNNWQLSGDSGSGTGDGDNNRSGDGSGSGWFRYNSLRYPPVLTVAFFIADNIDIHTALWEAALFKGESP